MVRRKLIDQKRTPKFDLSFTQIYFQLLLSTFEAMFPPSQKPKGGQEADFVSPLSLLKRGEDIFNVRSVQIET